MMRRCSVFRFRVLGGKMFVDFKLLSRDHRKSLVVEGAMVDPMSPITVVPLSWLSRLRSPSTRLPTGYFVEKRTGGSTREELLSSSCSVLEESCAAAGCSESRPEQDWEGIVAGPVVMYIDGESKPVVVNPLFVAEDKWGFYDVSYGTRNVEMDLRIGLDAIEQCSLFSELRPGGLLYSGLPIHANDPVKATERPHETLGRFGMKCGLSESPLNPRPWTRMKYMTIDELQRGPKLTEFVGYNPRSGTPWRFSQHNRYFRQGIWKEIVRRNEMNPGLHAHSSWQKSPQQAVPEVPFMAPYP